GHALDDAVVAHRDDGRDLRDRGPHRGRGGVLRADVVPGRPPRRVVVVLRRLLGRGQAVPGGRGRAPRRRGRDAEPPHVVGLDARGHAHARRGAPPGRGRLPGRVEVRRGRPGATGRPRDPPVPRGPPAPPGSVRVLDDVGAAVGPGHALEPRAQLPVALALGLGDAAPVGVLTPDLRGPEDRQEALGDAHAERAPVLVPRHGGPPLLGGCGCPHGPWCTNDWCTKDSAPLGTMTRMTGDEVDGTGAAGAGAATLDPLALEAQVCFALSAGARGMVALYRPLLEPLGITHPQYLVLLALWQDDAA